jgi:2-(1,2-epoxy-1,2-dihydrophenyl)acetyl-CoA isomerase
VRIRGIEKPVIAAVNGVAAGAGANIALACDIVYAGRSASFIQAFSKIGLIPDSGGTYTLPRLVGLQLASALMITGDKLTAEDAKGFGLVYKVFEDAELLEQSIASAVKVAALPTKAIGLTKRLLNHTYSNTLQDQLNMERDLQVASAKSHDHLEGVKAFLEKRSPNFTGE